MLPPHIMSPSDLVTSREDTRQGFLDQAKVKTSKASPFVDEAEMFGTALRGVVVINDLPAITVESIREALLAAAGFSDKARRHLSEADIRSSLNDVLKKIEEIGNDSWREELLYRFLLTRGDTLGGMMRNYTGSLGGSKLAREIMEALARKAVIPRVERSPDNPDKFDSLEWDDRVLTFDKKPKIVGYNIDAILLNTRRLPRLSRGSKAGQLASPIKAAGASDYLACGELKGGIDPAGADEHWKTARAAFDRIRSAFMEPPSLFFVGAAIKPNMAGEIFQQLTDGRLAYAANLTVPQQVSDLADWIVDL